MRFAMNVPAGRNRVFISYRRSDSDAEAGRLRDSLTVAFGGDNVFQDVLMTPGETFDERLLAELDQAAVLLVAIGETWLSAADEFHRRRIDLKDDWVRNEIIAGLSGDAVVIPVLINEALLPPAVALPTGVQDLAKQQAVTLRTDHWDQDVDAFAVSLAAANGWTVGAEPGPALTQGAAVQPQRAVRLFGAPPFVVENFQDRSNLLDQIGGTDTTVLSAVAGIGGVGKSQLAAKFFQDNQRDFDFACWIDMRDRDGRTGFEQIAQALNVAQPEIDPTEAVRNFMRGGDSSWLVVFDNAENPEQIQRLWPQSTKVKTVVTSRYRSWGAFGETVKVPVFDPDVAVTYLLSVSGRTDQAGAAELVTALGYLPLAIGLAGGFCRNRGLSFTEYCERLPTEFEQVLAPRSAGAYDRAINALWEDSLDAAERDDSACRAVIELMSVLDWTDVGVGWLAERLEWEANRLEDALAVLASYSLIEIEEGRATITHNLLADGIAKAAKKFDLAERVIPLLAGSVPEWSATQKTTLLASEPIRHVQQLVFNHPDLVTRDLLATLRAAIYQIFAQGSTSRALHHPTIGLHIKCLGTDHRYTMNCRSNLASSYQQAGRTNDAITIEEAVLADRERILGPDHPDTLHSRANLAHSYWQIGRTDEAITIEEAVLADRKRILGPEHPNTLTTLNNLAHSYWQADRVHEATGIFETVLTDRERILGPDHPDTLTSRANLAYSYREAGRVREATSIFEAVLSDRERILGPDHPDTLSSRANLAYSYWLAGRNDEAITIGEAVLTDRERILGPDHPHTSNSRANLVASYRQAGRTDDAERIERE